VLDVEPEPESAPLATAVDEASEASEAPVDLGLGYSPRHLANEVVVVPPTESGEGYELAPMRAAPVERRRLTRPTHVVDDRLCAGCGYALRGLPIDGVCPECGLEMTPPGQVHLDDIGPAWRERVAKGLDVYAASAVAGLGLWFVFITGLLPAILATMAWLLVSSASLTGAILSAAPEPDRRGGRTLVEKVMIGLAALGVAAVVPAIAYSVMDAIDPNAAWLARLAGALIVIGLGTHTATAVLASTLASRADEEVLAERAEHAATSFTLALGIAVLFGGFAMMISYATGRGTPIVPSGACGLIGFTIVMLTLAAFVLNYAVVLRRLARRLRTGGEDV
jgi:hypothetical protein